MFLSASLHFSHSVEEMSCQYFKLWQNDDRETIIFEQLQPFLFLSKPLFFPSYPAFLLSAPLPKDNHTSRAEVQVEGESIQNAKNTSNIETHMVEKAPIWIFFFS